MVSSPLFYLIVSCPPLPRSQKKKQKGKPVFAENKGVFFSYPLLGRLTYEDVLHSLAVDFVDIHV